jgi:hypothetical protein
MDSLQKAKIQANGSLVDNTSRNIQITRTITGVDHATYVVDGFRFSHNDGTRTPSYLDYWEGCKSIKMRPLGTAPFARNVSIANDTKHPIAKGVCVLNAYAIMYLHQDCLSNNIDWNTFLSIVHKISEDELFAYFCGRTNRSMVRALKDVDKTLLAKMKHWYNLGKDKNPLALKAQNPKPKTLKPKPKRASRGPKRRKVYKAVRRGPRAVAGPKNLPIQGPKLPTIVELDMSSDSEYLPSEEEEMDIEADLKPRDLKRLYPVTKRKRSWGVEDIASNKRR